MLAALLFLTPPLVYAQTATGPPPASADNGAPGGIFGMTSTINLGTLFGKSGGGVPSLGSPAPKSSGKGSSFLETLAKGGNGDLETALGGLMGGRGPEGIPGGTLNAEQWAHPGTGPYPAQYFTDASLPEKTIYAPKVPPKDNLSMPVILWAEGGCFKTGTFYQPFLTEIASHGYIVLANGPPVGGPPKTVADMAKLMTLGQNKIADLKASLDWALKGNGAKYGNIDTAKVAAGGQSCGGTEALSISYHNDLVKLTFLVNSGVLNPTARVWLKELKYPVGYFNGGPKDIAYQNGLLDYPSYSPTLPVLMANLDAGHGGTLFGLNGGKFGKAVVAFLQWNLRNDMKSKAIILDPKAPGSLVAQNWNVTAKNWT